MSCSSQKPEFRTACLSGTAYLGCKDQRLYLVIASCVQQFQKDEMWSCVAFLSSLISHDNSVRAVNAWTSELCWIAFDHLVDEKRGHASCC